MTFIKRKPKGTENKNSTPVQTPKKNKIQKKKEIE